MFSIQRLTTSYVVWYVSLSHSTTSAGVQLRVLMNSNPSLVEIVKIAELVFQTF